MNIAKDARTAVAGLPLAGLAVVEVVLFSVLVTAVSLLGAGIGLFLIPAAAVAARGTVNVTRRLAGARLEGGIPEPYLPEPPREGGLKSWWARTQWILTDPATWRDLAWMLVNPVVGLVLVLLPLILVAFGVFGLLMPMLWEDISGNGGNNWYWFVKVTDSQSALYALGLGVPTLLIGLVSAPALMRAHARLARTLLAPTETSRKVLHLTRTRSEVVSSSAAELRRIERDLHDGAQARLVALGMNLGVAEQLLAKDPEAVRAILADTRKASANALTELRDLIRGIHPPVLADRGLADAVRALALDSPLDVSVTAELPGRADAPVESALYFAVSEILTNAAKHASPTHVDVDLWYADGRIRAQVSDDGHGGADPSRGTGLRGIERRLAAFDGVLAVHSPVGGPTTLTLEIPCALS
ncbi:sensor domain-containing protein [Streptomyces phaeoluteigriseus]|uniref:histidine kinase n=1 Tax=Streptomyces phaeoluteigriseus TaxID=114686 RepID=A0ABY4ZKD7_9ACTN|nr:sensor histidine kinase [Streptomyces phaeoluteigriseus]USQ88818.1 sensor domain-containing protein [Streptomyces phaeoluteigriseus]